MLFGWRVAPLGEPLGGGSHGERRLESNEQKNKRFAQAEGYASSGAPKSPS